jgi:hypothetical protein
MLFEKQWDTYLSKLTGVTNTQREDTEKNDILIFLHFEEIMKKYVTEDIIFSLPDKKILY